MYHTWFFFRRLALSLDQKLKHGRLLECFSQERDELVLRFYLDNGDDFYLKADLQQGVCLLSFPPEMQRSRSNSADIFPELLGLVVTGVEPTLNDRSFHVRFSHGLILCFKMYGNRSNLLVHNEQEVLSVFNHHLKKDLESAPPQAKIIDQSDEAFLKSGGNLKSLFPTFSLRMRSYWDATIAPLPLDQQWIELTHLLQKLDSGPFFLCRQDDEVFLSFWPLGEVVEKNDDPIQISNRLRYYYWQVNRFFRQKALLKNQLDQELLKARQARDVAEKRWFSAQEAIGYRYQADLLMAYGHQVARGEAQVSLPDFDTGKPVDIKLKTDLSLHENAERLYRKAKGQDQDVKRLSERVRFWEEQIQFYAAQLVALSQAAKWPDLKPFEESSSPSHAEIESLPYHTLVFLGYEIRVGKNAKANDEILRLAHKDDLWLHARDVTGSHVIIRQRKGQVVPAPVKERAAQLAAFFSKAKTESLVPVMVTERKYVRKVKGTAAGQVKVEREKTLLVQPVGLP